jgi:hypothetical protein
MLAMMRRLAFAIGVAVGVAVGGTAIAGPVDPTEAGEIFLQGRELVKLGRFDEACALFARSYELDPALGTAVNLADCLERQGRLKRAWALFDVVARNSQNVQSRARLARQRADALQARLAIVIIKLREPAPPGLSIRIGDRQVTPAPEIRDLIEPRDVELVASVPGRPAFRIMLHAVAGATVSADVPAFTALHDESAVATRRRRSRVYLAGAITGAGAVGLGVSLGFAISARRLYTSAFDHDCMHSGGAVACTANGKATIDRAGSRADVASAFAIAGGLVVAAGAAVYLTAPRDTVQVAPIAGGHELGLGVAGRF